MTTFEDFESEAEREEREATSAGKVETTPNMSWEEIEEEVAEHHAESARAAEPFWK